MQLYRWLMLLSFVLGSTYLPCLGPVHNLWIGGGGGGGYGDLKGGINFHPKHLEGAIKIQLVLCIRHGGGGQLKLTLIIGVV